MKHTKSLLGLAGLGIALVSLAAQPACAGPGGARQGGKGDRAARGQRTMSPAKLIEHLEQVTGKPLTDDQKTAVTKAAETQQAANKAASDLFMQQVAAALNTTEDDLKGKLKGQKGAPGQKGAGGEHGARGERKRGAGADQLIEQLTAAGYTVSDAQKASITQAVETRMNASKAASTAMHESVAQALGITADDLQAKEKEYRKAHPREPKK